MKYQVRIKEWESKRWKVVKEFDTMKEAKRYAINLDFQNRRNQQTELTKIDIKNTETGERFMIADW